MNGDVGAVDYRVNERRRKAMLNAALNGVLHGVAAAYCLMTLSQPNRLLMLAAYGSGTAIGVIGYWAAKTVTPKILGFGFTFTMLVGSIAALSLGTYWDGGVSSPLTVGFVASAIVVASFTARFRLLIGLETVIIGGYLAVAAVRPTRPSFVFVYVAGMLAVMAVCTRQAKIMARQRAQLRALAELDPLTGALNRRGLSELTERLFADGPGPARAVVCLDLDDFKTVNDRLGHAAGDELLQWTVSTARTVLRDGDAVARTGGDEFVIVLAEADEVNARAVADRVRRVIRERTGVSIGWATAPHDGDTFDALVRAADQRLYREKQDRRATKDPTGRNGERSVRA